MNLENCRRGHRDGINRRVHEPRVREQPRDAPGAILRNFVASRGAVDEDGKMRLEHDVQAVDLRTLGREEGARDEVPNGAVLNEPGELFARHRPDERGRGELIDEVRHSAAHQEYRWSAVSALRWFDK